MGPVYRLSRTLSTQLIPQAADQRNALQFSLASLPQLTDLTNLYDQYSIERVTVTFRVPRVAAPAATGEVYPVLTWALDTNDGVAPASKDDILAYSSCRIHQFGEGTARVVRWSLTPKLNQSNPGGTFQSAAKLWVNTADTTVVYHGLKWQLDFFNSTTFNNTVVFVDVKYDLALRVAK